VTSSSTIPVHPQFPLIGVDFRDAEGSVDPVELLLGVSHGETPGTGDWTPAGTGGRSPKRRWQPEGIPRLRDVAACGAQQPAARRGDAGGGGNPGGAKKRRRVARRFQRVIRRRRSAGASGQAFIPHNRTTRQPQDHQPGGGSHSEGHGIQRPDARAGHHAGHNHRAHEQDTGAQSPLPVRHRAQHTRQHQRSSGPCPQTARPCHWCRTWRSRSPSATAA
jgi:hypothetical protein